jgi:hypothetical protein
MTTPTDIDRTAPVIAHHEIDINDRAAPLEHVWREDPAATPGQLLMLSRLGQVRDRIS